MSQGWRSSLHGGHSVAYCDHAEDTLEDLIEAAVAAGLQTFACTEHAPRAGAQYLYDEERRRGWTVDTLYEMMAAYAAQLDTLRTQYADRITLLKGFEAEVVPPGRYAEIMGALRDAHDFEWIVGSVHYVNEIIIDFSPAMYAEAAQAAGGVEALAVAYYEQVAQMASALQPNVIGHLDLVAKHAPAEAAVSTPAVREAAACALDAIAAQDSIVEVNTAGYRKGLGRPYPAPWLVEAAAVRAIPLALSDDSHRVADVGAHYEEAAAYLRGLGIAHVIQMVREVDGSLARRRVPLPNDTSA